VQEPGSPGFSRSLLYCRGLSVPAEGETSASVNTSVLTGHIAVTRNPDLMLTGANASGTDEMS
jgi:hypothetical protein